MAYDAKAQAKYNKKSAFFAINYGPNDQKEAERLKRYLDQNNISFNAYAKSLIRKDLDEKGIKYIDKKEGD